MRFGEVPVGEAAGAILAHSLALPGGRLRKGRVLTAADCAAAAAAGVGALTVARPEPGDVGEDEAATRLLEAILDAAAGLGATPAATGRANLRAERVGILDYDAAAVHRLNAVDPGITLALRAPVTRAAAGQIVGTAKIIPYAVPGAALEAACRAASGVAPRVDPAVLSDASLILTELPGLPGPAPGAAKAEAAIAGRLAAIGARLAVTLRVPHEVAAIARAIADAPGAAILILTASATSDVRDTAPEAVRAAGGEVTRFGMPVDPGNLLFVGRIGARPVIGLPGCARAPALNGADWVLDRIFAGLPCGDAEIASMGVGGLLKESPARGRPRAP